MADKTRVGVIGSTGRGDYGHGLDRAWLEMAGAEVVAVADEDAAGLAGAVGRLGGGGKIRGFADYREMLDAAQPEVVSICPRWLDRHRDMAVAAAERGVRGIYLEKPLCRDLEEADGIVAACEKHGVKLAIAFQTRYSPKLPVVRGMIEDGAIGRVLEIRARGKEDTRGGGEDLWVLGTHLFNLVGHFAGEPRECSASVFEGGQRVTREHVTEGPEGIGLLAGDHVRACYAHDGGVSSYFDSVRDAKGSPSRFGIMIYGSRGIIAMTTGYLPAASWLPDPSWTPARSGKRWVPISSAGPGKPEPLADGGLHAGNRLACEDLLAAIREDRQPEANVYEARGATEMIAAVFESHRLGRPAAMPLANRKNPLALL